nr:uncharacterized protein LOC128686999 [Cherax quadricarinatus]
MVIDNKDHVIQIKSAAFGLISIQLDESTNATSCFQMLVFARNVYSVSLFSLPSRGRNSRVKTALITWLLRYRRNPAVSTEHKIFILIFLEASESDEHESGALVVKSGAPLHCPKLSACSFQLTYQEIVIFQSSELVSLCVVIRGQAVMEPAVITAMLSWSQQ